MKFQQECRIPKDGRLAYCARHRSPWSLFNGDGPCERVLERAAKAKPECVQCGAQITQGKVWPSGALSCDDCYYADFG